MYLKSILNCLVNHGRRNGLASLQKTILVCAIGTLSVFAQSKSAVQFYDTTGQTKTGKVGWTGDAATGHFFIQVPGSGDLIKSQTDGISVNGTVTATKFAGDGSTLTNLPAPAATTVGSVTGLQDSLNKKANSSDVSTLQGQVSAKADTTWVKTKIGTPVDTSWINGKLSTKANASDVTTLQGQIGAKADSTSVNTKLSTKANTSDVTALQTTVSSKADTTWVKGKLGIKADTSWVKTQISASGAGQIVDGSVTTAKIADKAVTDAKIDSVSFGKLKGVPSFALTTNTTFDSLYLRTLITSGNVGIGTTIPDPNSQNVSLNVNKGSIQVTGMGAANALYFGNNAVEIYRETSPTGRLRLHGFGGIDFGTNTTGAGGAATILDNGNVGIGTTSPQKNLHVVGIGNDYALRICNNSASGSVFTGLEFNFENGIAGRNLAAITATTQGGGGGDLQFQTAASASASYDTKMIIQRDGNVGIGTSIPANLLDVGNATGNPTARINGGATGHPTFQLSQNSTVRAWFYVTSAGILKLNTTATDIDGISINGTNVGIGTTSPGALLDVNGSFQANCVTTALSTCISDRRYKTDITPIDSSLSKVSKLQGVYYNWDRKKWPQKNFSEGKQVGLIAQEVEKVVPEVVNTDKEGYKSLAYDKLTAVLIEAVKEQQKQIESQKEMIVSLKKEMEGMKTGIKK